MGLSTQGWIIVSPWGDVIGMPHRRRTEAIMHLVTNFDGKTYDAAQDGMAERYAKSKKHNPWPIPVDLIPEARTYWRRLRRAGWIAAHCYIQVADCRVAK